MKVAIRLHNIIEGALLGSLVMLLLFIIPKFLAEDVGKSASANSLDLVFTATEVYILTENVREGEIIKEEYIKLRKVQGDIIPTNVIAYKEDVVGKVANINLGKNTILTYPHVNNQSVDKMENTLPFPNIQMLENIVPGDNVGIYVKDKGNLSICIIEQLEVMDICNEVVYFKLSSEKSKVLNENIKCAEMNNLDVIASKCKLDNNGMIGQNEYGYINVISQE